VSVLHDAPAAQSTGPAHGNAHFWNWTLQRASPHEASLVQGRANAPGVAIVPAGAAAVGVVATGGGVAAVTAGCGCVWATVGAGATYGAGVAAGGSLSLAQALTTETTPARAMRDLRSIEVLFPRRIGRLSERLRVRAQPLPHPNRDFAGSVRKRSVRRQGLAHEVRINGPLPSAECQEYVRYTCSAPSGSSH